MPDCYLKAAKSISQFVNLYINTEADESLNRIDFVRTGENAKGTTPKAGGLLGTATDWQTQADLKQQMKFPTEIIRTPHRLDIFIWSVKMGKVVMLVTVSWEKWIEVFERKVSKCGARTYPSITVVCTRHKSGKWNHTTAW